MGTYIITYDLNQETRRPPIVQDIRDTWPDHKKLSESSYAISALNTPREIYDHLSRHLDGNDTLYVITLSRPYYGQGPRETNVWLDRKL